MDKPRMTRGWEIAARECRDRVALLADDETWTYGDLDAVAGGLAAHLAGSGVGPGDRVALMMANRPEFVVAVIAIAKTGAATVLLNPAWKQRELQAAVDLTTPCRAVTDSPAADALAALFGPDRIVDLDDSTTREKALVRSPSPPAQAPSATDEAVLVFSSGTTGLPKAVRHTHASMSRATTHWCRALGLGPHDRFQVATPPSHILGLLNLLAAAEAGAAVRLHRRFDLDEVLHRIESERMTLEMAVAPIALAMAQHPRLDSYDLSSLRYIMWCATPVTRSVADEVTARTGVRWLCGYGASELPVLAVNPVNDPGAWRLDSAGRPPEDIQLRIADLDTGTPLPPGGIGEIQARSPSVMAGYLPDEANADAFADGWYRTGDVGWLEPDGWVHITDRCKEMIKVKGFQVAPAEIEAVLLGHPGVRDCAVFGMADDVAGEVPVAAVALSEGHAVTGAQLQELVATSLASYKRLGEVVVVSQIPRLPSGKVLRRQLRDEWAQRLDGSQR